MKDSERHIRHWVALTKIKVIIGQSQLYNWYIVAGSSFVKRTKPKVRLEREISGAKVVESSKWKVSCLWEAS